MFIYILFPVLSISSVVYDENQDHIVTGIFSVLDEPEEQDHIITGILNLLAEPAEIHENIHDERISQLEVELTNVQSAIEQFKLNRVINIHLNAIVLKIRACRSPPGSPKTAYLSKEEFEAIQKRCDELYSNLESAESIPRAYSVRTEFERFLVSLRVRPPIIWSACRQIYFARNTRNKEFVDILALENRKRNLQQTLASLVFDRIQRR